MDVSSRYFDETFNLRLKASRFALSQVVWPIFDRPQESQPARAPIGQPLVATNYGFSGTSITSPSRNQRLDEA
jgi:hypothetical protein